MESANLELVQRLYAAFIAGNIEPVLDAVAPGADWRMVGSGCDYPGFQQCRGPDDVRAFFEASGQWAYRDFSIREMFASADKVFVLGHLAGALKRNGYPVESEWVHVFTIADGRVTRFREFLDSAQVVAAWRA